MELDGSLSRKKNLLTSSADTNVLIHLIAFVLFWQMGHLNFSNKGKGKKKLHIKNFSSLISPLQKYSWEKNKDRIKSNWLKTKTEWKQHEFVKTNWACFGWMRNLLRKFIQWTRQMWDLSRNLLSNLLPQGNEITFLYIDSSQGQSLGEGDQM